MATVVSQSSRRSLSRAVLILAVVASLLAVTSRESPAAAQLACRDRLTAAFLGQVEQFGCPRPIRRPIADRADPFVLFDEGRAYVYGTRTATRKLPVVYGDVSGRLATVDALPQVPAWSDEHSIWAPSVVRIGNTYVLYYATRHVETGRQCVSRAPASSPLGPFVDRSPRPLVCQHDTGGTIDPSLISDADGRLHILYKNDGNCCGFPVTLFSQPLREDGLELDGNARELVSAEGGWEGWLIEAPSMVALPDRGYLLSYSANRFRSASYATGFALCETVVGPCRKIAGPWQPDEPDLLGTGGLEFTPLPGTNDIALTYHGWRPGVVGINGGRSVRVGLSFPADQLVCHVLGVAECDGVLDGLLSVDLLGPRALAYTE